MAVGNLTAVAAGLGAAVGTGVTLRVYLIRPLRRAVADFRSLLELPDMVADLTRTTVRYWSESERRIATLEGAVASLLLRKREGDR